MKHPIEQYKCCRTLVDKHGYAKGALGCIVEVFEEPRKNYYVDIVNDEDGDTIDDVEYFADEVEILTDEEYEEARKTYHLVRTKEDPGSCFGMKDRKSVV